MEIAELKQQYIDLGGDPKTAEQINDESILVEFIRDLNEIKTFQAKKDKNRANNTVIVPNGTKLLKQWQELAENDFSKMTADELRKHENTKTNVLYSMTELVMPEPGMAVLDEQLRMAVIVGIENALIDSYDKNSYERKDLKDRILDMKTIMAIEVERDSLYDKYIEQTTDKVKFLTDNRPEAYILDINGATIINPELQVWGQELQKVQKSVTARIKGEWSEFKDTGDEPDQRTKIFLIEKQLASLTGTEPYTPPANYFDHEPDGLRLGVAK